MCVFIRPNTFLLCIFLFCVFFLYRTDSHVEVQIRILLKDKYKKSCQKCKHLQSYFDFLKNAYPVSLFLRNNSRAKNIFLLLCVAFFLCMDLQPYSHDCYSKMLETILIGFFILEKKLANILLFLFLINSLLLYIPLLALADRQTDRESNTFASRELEEPFFPVVLYVVSVFSSGGKKVLVYIRMYYLEYNKVVVVC